VATLAFALLVCGCSYPDASFGADTAGSDASVDVGVETDVGIDAVSEGAPDIADVFDSSTDSGTEDVIASDSGDSGPTGCAAKHLFCRDFDTVKAVEEGWFTNLAVGGTVSLDGTDFFSSAHSARSEIPAVTGGGVEPAAMLYNEFDRPSSGMTVRADMWLRFEKSTYDSEVRVVSLYYDENGEGFILYVDAFGSFLSFPSFSLKFPTPLPEKKWFRFRIDAVMADALKSTVNVYVDDMTKPVLSKSGFTLKSPITNNRIDLFIGAYASAPNTAFKAWYDDVSFDFLP